MSPQTGLSPRVTPRQHRAQATLDRLLDKAAELLTERGLEGFNTNLLAERAQVRVSTVYRYFPNKHAVLAALSERFFEAERDWLGNFDALARATDWRQALRETLAHYAERSDAYPAVTALRRASRASAELQALEMRSNEALAKLLAGALRARGKNLSAQASLHLARTTIEVACHLTDVSRSLPPRARNSQRSGLADMLERFLAPELD